MSPTSPTGNAQELVAAVQANLDGTPYVLTETADGFDVQLDLADATWYGLMDKKHLSQTWIYRVRLDEAQQSLQITDDVRSVSWKAGLESSGGIPTPVLGGSASRYKGRFEVKSVQKVYGVDEQGQAGKVVDYDFTASEGRNLIREPAKAQGWSERMGGSQKAGALVGFGVIGLLVLAGIIVAIVAIAGGF